MKYVIIGAGSAGCAAAEAIRETDPDSDVVLIGAEHFLPYKRYLLTEFLCDTVNMDTLVEMPVKTIKDMGIAFRKGQYVKFIDPVVKKLKLHHNEEMSYDKLLIATGGCPTLGPALRPYYQNIQLYYSLRDAQVIKQNLDNIQHCIVSGEGLSSLDLMCGLCKMGKKVTYIVRGDRADFPFIDDVNAGLTEPLHSFLEKQGVKIITHDRITSVKKEDGKYRVLTLDQKELSADIVFASDYYQPNIPFLQETEMEKKLGILVDQHLHTSEYDVYAAGDCVEIYHPGLRNYWINFGWKNAAEQGRIAGINMAGGDEIYNVKDTLVFNLMGKPLKARWWE